LLSFRIASRQYRQIFRHRHRPGISSNIADTYLRVQGEKCNEKLHDQLACVNEPL
jgi:hypothetical protein